MKLGYEIHQECLVPTDAERPTILVYDQPSDHEKQELLETLDLYRQTLESIPDRDEISRVEITSDRVLTIWKRLDSISYQQQMGFEYRGHVRVEHDGARH